jgi:hypothetical protein
VLEGSQSGHVSREQPTAVAGSAMSVVLVAHEEAPPQPKPVPIAPEPEKRAGWSPIVVAVGGGLTAVAGGLLIWSGIDTMNQRSTFNANPTQANLDTGRSDETRTNVFVGVTAGVGLITAIVAIFLVDWKPRHKVDVQAGLRGVTLGARF